jgi:hypothetical protein
MKTRQQAEQWLEEFFSDDDKKSRDIKRKWKNPNLYGYPTTWHWGRCEFKEFLNYIYKEDKNE